MINSQILRGFVPVVSMVATCCTYFSHDVMLLNTRIRMLEKSFFPFFAWFRVVRLSKKVKFSPLRSGNLQNHAALEDSESRVVGKNLHFFTCGFLQSNMSGSV